MTYGVIVSGNNVTITQIPTANLEIVNYGTPDVTITQPSINTTVTKPNALDVTIGQSAQSTVSSVEYRTGTRTNIVANPSLETNATSWVATSGTVARITTDFYIGNASLRYTNTVAGTTAGGANFQSATGGRNPVDASTAYAITCYVFIPVGQPSVSMRLRRTEFTAVTGGSQVGGILLTSTTTFTAGTGWNRFFKTFTTQAGVAGITCRLEQGVAATLGQIWYIDAVMLEKGSTADYYFDGSYTDTPIDADPVTAWTGTANNSTSIMTQNAAGTLTVTETVLTV